MAKIIDNLDHLILQAAKDIAYEEGLGQINMRKIAAQCHIATGTIYNYYPNKIDLIIAVVEDFWIGCFQNLGNVLKEELDFFPTLERIYFHILEYLEQFKRNLLAELSLLDNQAKDIGKQKESLYMNKFSHILVELMRKHKEKLNNEVINQIGEVELAHFIFSNYLMMLKSESHQYNTFDYILKKILL